MFNIFLMMYEPLIEIYSDTDTKPLKQNKLYNKNINELTRERDEGIDKVKFQIEIKEAYQTHKHKQDKQNKVDKLMVSIWNKISNMTHYTEYKNIYSIINEESNNISKKCIKKINHKFKKLYPDIYNKLCQQMKEDYLNGLEILFQTYNPKDLILKHIKATGNNTMNIYMTIFNIPYILNEAGWYIYKRNEMHLDYNHMLNYNVFYNTNLLDKKTSIIFNDKKIIMSISEKEVKPIIMKLAEKYKPVGVTIKTSYFMDPYYKWKKNQ